MLDLCRRKKSIRCLIRISPGNEKVCTISFQMAMFLLLCVFCSLQDSKVFLAVPQQRVPKELLSWHYFGDKTSSVHRPYPYLPHFHVYKPVCFGHSYLSRLFSILVLWKEQAIQLYCKTKPCSCRGSLNSWVIPASADNWQRCREFTQVTLFQGGCCPSS